MAKRRANPNREICVSCGACVLECPREAITIFKGCYAVVDAQKCIGCGLCHKACPANAITMEEVVLEVEDGGRG